METAIYEIPDRQTGRTFCRKGRMIWKFCLRLEEMLKPPSRYYMAKKVFGVAPQQYDRYRDPEKKARSLPSDVLANIRFNSGLTWEKFGKLYDEYFLKKQ